MVLMNRYTKDGTELDDGVEYTYPGDNEGHYEWISGIKEAVNNDE